MDAQIIIYKRIELYNKELEKTLLLEDKQLREMKKFVIESILQELDILLIEFQE